MRATVSAQWRSCQVSVGAVRYISVRLQVERIAAPPNASFRRRSTSVARSSAETELFKRGISFEIPGEEVDGMDVLAVREAAAKAVARARDGEGPYILEMKTYRYRGHSMSDPAKYRTREEVQDVREHRDPIEMLKKKLIDAKQATEDDLKAIEKEIREVVNDAAEFAQQSPEPDPSELWTDVLVEGRT